MMTYSSNEAVSIVLQIKAAGSYEDTFSLDFLVAPSGCDLCRFGQWRSHQPSENKGLQLPAHLLRRSVCLIEINVNNWCPCDPDCDPVVYVRTRSSSRQEGRQAGLNTVKPKRSMQARFTWDGTRAIDLEWLRASCVEQPRSTVFSCILVLWE